MIQRLSDILTMMKCPEQWRRNMDEGYGPGNVYTVGGITCALVIEEQVSGRCDNISEDEVVAWALSAALTEEQTRTADGKVWMTPTQGGMIVDRVGTILYHFREWVKTCGLEFVAAEVEIRSLHRIERGGRMDFLVRRKSDGAYGIIDGKAFGVFGKSVSAQANIPDLRRENQCGWYGSIMARGCTGFIGVPNRHRHLPTDELKKLYKHKEFSVRPSFYGQIQYGHLIPFSRNGKTAVKGEFRGDVLYTAPLHNHLIRNADSLSEWYHWASSSPSTPSVRKYDAGGKYNCDKCRYAETCWPDEKTPEPVAEMPSFIKELTK